MGENTEGSKNTQGRKLKKVFQASTDEIQGGKTDDNK